LETIRLQRFPIGIQKEQNPYLKRKENPIDGKSTNIALAEEKMWNDPSKFTSQYVNSFDKKNSPSYQSSLAKVNVPSLLTLMCNTIEAARLRQELMLCISECIEL
jgi:hypothetical protein